MHDLEPLEDLFGSQGGYDGEPGWLIGFSIQICCGLDVNLICRDCHEVIGNFDAFYEDDNNLVDFKQRAYEHMEECGK